MVISVVTFRIDTIYQTIPVIYIRSSLHACVDKSTWLNTCPGFKNCFMCTKQLYRTCILSKILEKYYTDRCGFIEGLKFKDIVSQGEKMTV